MGSSCRHEGFLGGAGAAGGGVRRDVRDAGRGCAPARDGGRASAVGGGLGFPGCPRGGLPAVRARTLAGRDRRRDGRRPGGAARRFRCRGGAPARGLGRVLVAATGRVGVLVAAAAPGRDARPRSYRLVERPPGPCPADTPSGPPTVSAPTRTAALAAPRRLPA